MAVAGHPAVTEPILREAVGTVDYVYALEALGSLLKKLERFDESGQRDEAEALQVRSIEALAKAIAGLPDAGAAARNYTAVMAPKAAGIRRMRSGVPVAAAFEEGLQQFLELRLPLVELGVPLVELGVPLALTASVLDG